MVVLKIQNIFIVRFIRNIFKDQPKNGPFLYLKWHNGQSKIKLSTLTTMQPNKVDVLRLDLFVFKQQSRDKHI